MNKTSITWCDLTWNPVTGCTRGCDYCFAQKIADRFSRIILEDGEPMRGGSARATYGDRPAMYAGEGETFPFAFDPTMYEHRLDDPLRRKKPSVIFLVSMGDLFDRAFPDEFRDKILDTICDTPWHTYMLLTKQAERMADFFRFRERIPNLWSGVTVTNQADADERIPLLLDTPAAHRFVSVEPMLGPVNIRFAHYVDLTTGAKSRLDLVIAGAKTPGKPLHETAHCIRGNRAERAAEDCGVCHSCPQAWLRSLRDQCLEAGVPFHYKAGSENPPLDGVVHDAGVPR